MRFPFDVAAKSAGFVFQTMNPMSYASWNRELARGSFARYYGVARGVFPPYEVFARTQAGEHPHVVGNDGECAGQGASQAVWLQ